MPRLYDPLAVTSRAVSRSKGPAAGGDEETLLRRLGRSVVSGVGAIGNVLDLPGSMVRDVLAGENPLDQLLDPTGSENRITGRDLTTRWGLTTANDPNRWEWADLGGFATELVTDPLSIAAAPIHSLGALSKAGQAASRAGLLDDFLRSAGRGATALGGKGARVGTLAEGVGRRKALLKHTLGDLLTDDDSIRAATQAAEGMGTSIEALRGERLGGLFGVTLPFRSEPIATFGTGELSQRVAGGLDTAFDALRYNPAGRLMAATFTKSADGITTRMGQEHLAESSARTRQAVSAARQEMAPHIEAFKQAGVFDDQELSRSVRRALEGVGPRGRPMGPDPLANLPPEVRSQLAPHIRGMQESLVRQFDREVAAGLDLSRLDDVLDVYFPRSPVQLAKGTGRGLFGSRVFPTSHGSQTGRQDALKGYFGGTDIINEMSMDPQFSGIAHRMTASEFTPELVQQKAEDLRRMLIASGEPASMIDEDLTGIVKWLADLDPQHAANKIGFFDTNPMDDYVRRMEMGERAIEGATLAKKMLIDGATSPTVVSAGESGWPSMFDAIQTLKLNDRAKREIAEALGWQGREAAEKLQPGLRAAPAVGDAVSVAGHHSKPGRLMIEGQDASAVGRRYASTEPGWYSLRWQDNNNIFKAGRATKVEEATSLDEFLKTVRVRSDVASDVGRVMKPFSGPELMQEWMKPVDRLTNWFKSNVTSLFPSFHARNFVSGQFQNMTIGAFSTRSVRAADSMVRGRTVKIASEIPGMSTDAAEATAQLRREMFAQGLVGHHQGQSLDIQGAAQSTLAGQFPGLEPRAGGTVESFRRGMADLLPETGPGSPSVASQYAPWNVRGAAADEDLFRPAIVGQSAAAYTEELNRVSPYIELRLQGLSPEEAAKRVRAAQVDYSDISGFERDVAKRVAPFYVFSRKMGEFLGNELVRRPGGLLGQTVKASGRASANDPGLPDYVAQGASIPVSGGPLESVFGAPTDNSSRYLTGLGLPFEDMAGFLGGGPTGALQELISRANPLIKTPLEAAAGESFFQRGPGGGRDLTDLDPTLGRTVSNVREMLGFGPDELPSGRARPLGSPSLEFLVGNSPAARLTTTLRTLSDPRKTPTAKAWGLLTGLRLSDVSERARDAVLREFVHQRSVDSGAKQYTNTYFPKGATLDPEQEALARLQKILADRAKAATKGSSRPR